MPTPDASARRPERRVGAAAHPIEAVRMFATTWDHIHLRSADPDASASFFETCLGATRLARVENGSELRVTVSLAGMTLYFDRAASGATLPSDPPVRGIDHVALAVQDLDAALAALRTKDVEIISGPTIINPRLRIAFIRAPDRVRVELLERH